jgi:predicted nucleic acid-binding protein
MITGDSKLQQLGTFRSVTILSPRAFLERLQAR